VKRGAEVFTSTDPVLVVSRDGSSERDACGEVAAWARVLAVSRDGSAERGADDVAETVGGEVAALTEPVLTASRDGSAARDACGEVAVSARGLAFSREGSAERGAASARVLVVSREGSAARDVCGEVVATADGVLTVSREGWAERGVIAEVVRDGAASVSGAGGGLPRSSLARDIAVPESSARRASAGKHFGASSAGSCQMMAPPSEMSVRSSSSVPTPSSSASSKPGSVLSGRSPRAPR
jgi:hypothetical protein